MITRYIISFLIMTTMLIQANQRAYGQEALERIISSTPTVKKYPKIDEEKSLFFQDQQVKWIDEAIKARESGEHVDSFMFRIFAKTKEAEKKKQILKDLVTEVTEEVEQEDIPIILPAYYLKTLLYFGPENWTIWLNQGRYSADEKHPGIFIHHVDSQRVIAIWQSEFLDEATPAWKQHFSAMDPDEILWINDDDNVMVHKPTGMIAFSLGINQSFSAQKTAVLEGEAKQVTITRKRADLERTLGNALTLAKRTRAEAAKKAAFQLSQKNHSHLLGQLDKGQQYLLEALIAKAKEGL